jgi:hypothetical protein
MVNLTRKILPGIARMIPAGHSQVNGGFNTVQHGGFNKWWQSARRVSDGQLEADTRCLLFASGEDRQHASADEQKGQRNHYGVASHPQLSTMHDHRKPLSRARDPRVAGKFG